MVLSHSSDAIACIVLCGGRGTRMGPSEIPKVCFPIDGVPAIVRAIRTYRACRIETIVLVVGAGAHHVIETTGREFPDLLFTFQPEPRGTGDAARVGFAPLDKMGFSGPIMIAAGDKLVEAEAVDTLKTEFYRSGADCAFLVSRKPKNTDLGRVAVDNSGRVLGIFETSDIRLAKLYHALKRMVARKKTIASQQLRDLCLSTIADPEKLAKRAPALWRLAENHGQISAQAVRAAIPPAAETIDVGGAAMVPEDLEGLCKLCNESFYMFDPSALAEAFRRLTPRPGRSEEYLTDAVNILAHPKRYGIKGEPAVAPVVVASPSSIQGFNTPDQLMAIEQYVSRNRARQKVPLRPAIGLGRASFRPVSEWLHLFRAMPPRFRSMLRGIYGDNPDLLKERARAYVRALQRFARRYGAGRRAVIVRAPGSVNLMGRHVDNRGGYVNLMNVAREIIMIASPRDDDAFALANVDRAAYPDTEFSLKREVSQLDWDDWLSYVQSDRVRRMVLDSKGDWGNYVKAAVLRLQQSFRHVPLRGMNCVVHGNIPPAAGLGASAAMLVAASDACIALNGLSVSPRAFLDLCGEGEWYVSGAGQTRNRVGMKIGGRGEITLVRYLPFNVERSVAFPKNHLLAICHCDIPRRRSRVVAGLKRQQIAAFDLALLLIKDRFPQYAHLLDHLRDLNTIRLGISLRQLYAMLLAVPESAGPDEIRGLLSSAHTDKLDAIFVSHDAPKAYDLRSATIFCAAECARSERFSELVAKEQLDEVGLLMARSHDAERLASLADGKLAPYAWQAGDEYLHSLIADLDSEDPERVLRAQLYMQPGRYGCGAAEIDAMVDLAASVPGVVGAQLSGVGIAGCIMVLVRDDAVDRLKRTLRDEFYRPRRLRADITVCTPIARAGVLGHRVSS
ncbi:MAG: NTP transferase domain-containing protein [Planctomycetota bacterium]